MSVEEVAKMVHRALTLWAIVNIASPEDQQRDYKLMQEYEYLCEQINGAFDNSTGPRMAGVLCVWEA